MKSQTTIASHERFNTNEVERVSLQDGVTNALEEIRMVLPGLQALFGFQLICIFNAEFGKLSSPDKLCNWLALLLSVISATLLMTPAAYDRKSGGRTYRIILYGYLAAS